MMILIIYVKRIHVIQVSILLIIKYWLSLIYNIYLFLLKGKRTAQSKDVCNTRKYFIELIIINVVNIFSLIHFIIRRTRWPF